MLEKDIKVINEKNPIIRLEIRWKEKEKKNKMGSSSNKSKSNRSKIIILPKKSYCNRINKLKIIWMPRWDRKDIK